MSKTLEVTFTLENGTTFVIDNSSICASPVFEINNKAVSEDDFMLGSVYMGECKFAFYTEIPRSQLLNAEIAVSYNEDGFEVSKGYFIVNEAERKNKVVEITAYDYMSKFDEEIDEDLYGNSYALAKSACQKVGVYLATTSTQFSNWDNSNLMLRASKATVETYRKLISNIATVNGCFATINGEGELEFKRFGTTPTASRDSNQRKNVTSSEFKIRYNKIKATLRDGKTYTSGDVNLSGSTLDLGVISALYENKTKNQTAIDNIFNVVKEIEYTPCYVECKEYELLKLGDMLQLPNVYNEEGEASTINTLIMSFTWRFRGFFELEGVGSNPLLKKGSEINNTPTSSQYTNTSNSETNVYKFTNLSQVALDENQKTICTTEAFSNADTTAILIATIPIEMQADGYVVFDYFVNNVSTDQKITGYLSRGKNIVTLSNTFNIESDYQVPIDIKANTEYFQSDIRILKNDTTTTAPTGTIPALGIRGTLQGRGLVESVEWNGRLNIFENVDSFEFNTQSDNLYDIIGIEEEVYTSYPAILGLTMQENIPTINIENIDSFDISDIADTVSVPYNIVANATDYNTVVLKFSNPIEVINAPVVVGFDGVNDTVNYPVTSYTLTENNTKLTLITASSFGTESALSVRTATAEDIKEGLTDNYMTFLTIISLVTTVSMI